MSTRPIFLLSSRNAPSQRAHFGIFVPLAVDPHRGTLINVVGAPMMGYGLIFQRNYMPATTGHDELVPIGSVACDHIVDTSASGTASEDSTPRGTLEILAAQVPPPRISENFMAPVNDTTNKRCQEWTMEYLRHLVKKGIIGAGAIEVVQSKRDSPTHGIGLQSVLNRVEL
ncbi:uncharacterized protein LDX57_006973 [Aspergillus melleus]|uniref:uncharacterized protein n=1 Tax=Aspergillus melleus TaxID=138277 RepID=UPI001E8EF075|nr:uncharacterized protein LDX57_006973 [Aspergillus melleus]KAH8429306.1 hypothetical protein LDX57_006973 [Aspergillus melleus]